ncbi:MAG: hypothetical protein IJF13_05505 [Clostridia bacterium]|nr:hypothetical protein [Clostridia bacterium]
MKEYLINGETKHSIKVTIRQFLYLPVLMTVIMLIVLPGTNIIMKSSSFRLMYSLGESIERDKLIGFSLYDTNQIVKFIPYVLMGISLVSAFLLFRFLFSKKAQAVYFLTGTSRGQLFLIRYMFGVISLAASVFLSLAVSVVINVFVSDATKFLISNGIYLFFAMFSMAYCCYSVCVVIMVLCGRGIDYFMSVAGVWSARILVLLFMQNVFFAFLPGTPYYFGQGNLQAGIYPSIFEKYSDVSFTKFFREIFETCGTAYGHKEGPDFDYAVAQFVTKPQMIILVFLVGAVFAFVGWLLFKKRKAELAETPSANNVLSNAVTLLISASIASCIFLAGGTFWHIVLFALILTAVYCVVISVFRGVVSKLYKSLPIPFFAVFVCGIFCLVCYFGGLGYSSYIPQIDDISCVQISYPGHPQYASVGSGYSAWSGSSYYFHYASLDNMTKLTEKEDVETVIDIHRLLIADGSRGISDESTTDYDETAVYANIYITYTLKDGSQITRFYRTLKLSTIFRMLDLEFTDAYIDLFKSKIKYFGADENDWTKEEYLETLLSMSAVYASDNLFSNLTGLSLTDTEKEELFDAIINDKSDDTVDERYRPQKECIGVLLITYNGKSDDAGDPKKKFDYFGQYYGTSHVYVYEDDKETITYLKNKGYYDAFVKDLTVTKIELYEFPLYPEEEQLQKSAYNRCFYSKVNTDLTERFTPFVRELAQTEYNEILQNARLTYFINGGQLVTITTVNSDGEERTVTKYLPINN